MTLQEFKASLQNAQPPTEINDLLRALWYDGKDDWNSAHDIAQEIPSKEGSWIHAYLHRKEGDIGNASYWYQRAAQPVAKNSLNDEWESLVKFFLK